MFRRLVVVPYGRMQLVDITAGPLDRRLGRRDGAAAHGGRDHERHDPRACRPPRRRAFVTGWRPEASSGAPGCDPAPDAGSGPRRGSRTGGADPSARSTPRRRTHPLTPLVASVRSLGVLVGVFVVFGSGNLRDLAANLGGLLGLVLILGALRRPDAGLARLQLPGVDPHGVLLRRVRRLPARLRGAAAQRAPRDPVAPAERGHDPAPARSGRGAVPGAHRGGRRWGLAGAALLPHRRRGAGPARRDHRPRGGDVPGRGGGPGSRPRDRADRRPGREPAAAQRDDGPVRDLAAGASRPSRRPRAPEGCCWSWSPAACRCSRSSASSPGSSGSPSPTPRTACGCATAWSTCRARPSRPGGSRPSRSPSRCSGGARAGCGSP